MTSDQINMLAAIAQWATIPVSILTLIYTVVSNRKSRAIALAANQDSSEANRIAVEANRQAEAANAIANQAARATLAGSETAVIAEINQSKRVILEIHMKILEFQGGRKESKLSADEKRLGEAYYKNYEAHMEVLFNSYDLACGMYKDEKLDKSRFELQYSADIRKICEENQPAYRKLLHPADTCKYQAIWAVYRHWNIKEKPIIPG